MFGTNLRTLLTADQEIVKPTRVRIDSAGKRFIVINKAGVELRNYKLNRKW